MVDFIHPTLLTSNSLFEKVIRMISDDSLSERLNRFLLRISGEGSWTLLEQERALVEAVFDSLEGNTRDLAFDQLKRPYFVERTSPQMSVLRHHPKPEELKIVDASFQDALFRIDLELDGKRRKANVTFYKGYLFSIEMRPTRDALGDLGFKILAVKRGKPSDTMTRTMDRSEHGSETQ